LHLAWIAGVVVVAIAIARLVRDGVTAAVVGLLVTVVVAGALVAAWVVPARDDAPARGDDRVLDTFATTSDPDLGRSVGLLAEQGFWRPADDRPRDDLGIVFPFVAGAVIAGAVAGLVLARGTPLAGLAAAIAGAGIVGWLLAHGADGPLGALYEFAFRNVPGFGLMREAQKWDALVCLAVAFGLGCFAAALARAELQTFAWIVVVLPFALAPTLVWGLTNRIEVSRYPESWARVRPDVAALEGEVVVLPWHEYVLPGFTGNRTVEQPAESYFGDQVIASRDPGVEGLPGDRGHRGAVATAIEHARADAAAGRTVDLGADLDELGVRGVLVVGDGGDDDDGFDLADDPRLRRAVADDRIALWVVEPRG
jgi:hypothetical protein